MPAGILPYTRQLNAFANVSPRYLEPIHREQQNYVPPPQTRYETQRQWDGVQPRYLTNVSSTEQQKLRDERELHAKLLAADHQDPLKGWEGAQTHREYSKRHLGGVAARYADDAQDKGHPAVTPRDLIKRKDEVEKMEKGWRGTHALNKYSTFDVLYAKWLKQHADDAFMKRKKNGARSPVSDYVRHGTPIESVVRGGGGDGGNGRAHTPNPSSRKNNHGDDSNNTTTNSRVGGKGEKRGSAAGGGGGGGKDYSSVRRTQSPWERGHSPDSFIGGRWKGSGVTSTSFDALRRQSMKLNPQYLKCEERAQEVIEHQREKKVTDESFVPRVAKLALVYQIPALHHQYDADAAGSAGSRPRSPSSRAAPANSNSPYRRNDSQHTKNNKGVSARTATRTYNIGTDDE